MYFVSTLFILSGYDDHKSFYLQLEQQQYNDASLESYLFYSNTLVSWFICINMGAISMAFKYNVGISKVTSKSRQINKQTKKRNHKSNFCFIHFNKKQK